MPRRRSNFSILSWVEIVVGIAATLGVVLLQFRMLRHAGGLWRDEAAMLHLAQLPSISDNWSMIEFEAFPLLWYLVLRGWLALGFGVTDVGLRVLGLLVVVGIAAALWWCARCFASGEWLSGTENLTPENLAGSDADREKKQVAKSTAIPAIPLLSLALAGCCTVLYQVGGSLRAYGFGIILLLLALGSLWRMVQSPSRGRVLCAAVTAVLSVQCLYYNAVLLLAMLLPAMLLCVHHHRPRRAVLVLGIGLLAAVSLLPYAGVIQRVHNFNMLVQSQSVEPLGLAENLVIAIDPDNAGTRWAWLLAAVLLSAAFFLRILVRSAEPWGTSHDRMFFLGTAAVLGIALQFGFLWMLSYVTSNSGWYYLTLLLLVPVLLDAGVQVQAERHDAWRFFRLGLVIAIVAFAWQSVWNVTGTRMTNMDFIARQIHDHAAPEDLVIVNPWWMGISFQRYYDGAAPWETLPAIHDHRAHRYDLLKERMMELEPNSALLERVDRTLQNGHRVWTVGPTYFARPQALAPLPPAPHSPTGWQEEPYQRYWRVQLAMTLQKPGFRYKKQQIDTVGAVLRHENPDLNVWERSK